LLSTETSLPLPYILMNHHKNPIDNHVYLPQKFINMKPLWNNSALLHYKHL